MTAKTNEKIVRAAAELFAERGYSAVSTKDIAKAAGVNETTLFRQFGDKRRIMMAAIDYEFATNIPPERIASALAIRDFEDAARTFARCLMQLCSTRYIRLTTGFAQEMPHRAVADFTRKRIKPVYNMLVDRIKEEQRAKRVHSSVFAWAIARGLISVVYGHAVAVAYFGPEWQRVTHVRPEHLDNYVTVWLRGVLVDSDHLPPCQ